MSSLAQPDFIPKPSHPFGDLFLCVFLGNFCVAPLSSCFFYSLQLAASILHCFLRPVMGGACCSEAELAPHHSGEANEPYSTLDPTFPMFVVPMEEFLRMSGPPRPHQLLVKEGRAIIRQRGQTCIFLSHQWLAFIHPDPEGRQLLVAQKALEALIEGRLAVEVCPIFEAYNPKSELPHWDQRKECGMLRESFIWYDYFSIPQLQMDVPCLEESSSGHQLASAVSSNSSQHQPTESCGGFLEGLLERLLDRFLEAAVLLFGAAPWRYGSQWKWPLSSSEVLLGSSPRWLWETARRSARE